MRRAFTRVVWVLPTLIAPAILLPACDSPGGPSEKASPPLALRIDGPSTLAPGTSAQYTAVRVLGDGTSQPVDARWTVTPAALLHVTPTGLVTAAAGLRGDGTIQVELAARFGPLGGQRVSREVVVVPSGTFRLAGQIFEADATNLPVPGARLEVSTDPDFSSTPSAVATTDADGRFRLYGVPSDSYLRVSRDGYVTRTDRIQLGAHDTRTFTLALSGERNDFAGRYAMVLEALQCSARPVPTEFRRREYEAVIQQSGRTISGTLTGAPFQISGDQGNRFSGTATSRSITIAMRDFYNFYYNPNGPPHPDVAELLPDASLLVAMGDSTLTWSGNSASGAWRGSLTHYSGQFPFPTFLGWCGGTRITLTRR